MCRCCRIRPPAAFLCPRGQQQQRVPCTAAFHRSLPPQRGTATTCPAQRRSRQPSTVQPPGSPSKALSWATTTTTSSRRGCTPACGRATRRGRGLRGAEASRARSRGIRAQGSVRGSGTRAACCKRTRGQPSTGARSLRTSTGATMPTSRSSCTRYSRPTSPTRARKRSWSSGRQDRRPTGTRWLQSSPRAIRRRAPRGLGGRCRSTASFSSSKCRPATGTPPSSRRRRLSTKSGMHTSRSWTAISATSSPSRTAHSA
mmetsp:Transcript_42877/g.141943  ORF Transcript_42877/g.141943 Transcript_42877/m.141943 type:complete len:258 (-) Transcript_42877:383-1156(-)